MVVNIQRLRSKGCNPLPLMVRNLAWNTRGIKSRAKLNEVRYFLSYNEVKLFGLFETRVNRVLPDILSSSQGVFVAGRSILSNVMIYQDLTKAYNRKSTRASCTMKLNL